MFDKKQPMVWSADSITTQLFFLNLLRRKSRDQISYHERQAKIPRITVMALELPMLCVVPVLCRKKKKIPSS